MRHHWKHHTRAVAISSAQGPAHFSRTPGPFMWQAWTRSSLLQRTLWSGCTRGSSEKVYAASSRISGAMLADVAPSSSGTVMRLRRARAGRARFCRLSTTCTTCKTVQSSLHVGSRGHWEYGHAVHRTGSPGSCMTCTSAHRPHARTSPLWTGQHTHAACKTEGKV